MGSYGIHDNEFIHTDKGPIMSVIEDKRACQQRCAHMYSCKSFIFKSNECDLYDSISHFDFKQGAAEYTNYHETALLSDYKGNCTWTN